MPKKKRKKKEAKSGVNNMQKLSCRLVGSLWFLYNKHTMYRHLLKGTNAHADQNKTTNKTKPKQKTRQQQQPKIKKRKEIQAILCAG